MKNTIAIILLSILMVSCRQSMSGDGDGHQDQGHDHDEGVIELTVEQMQNIGIAFEKLDHRAIRSLVKLNGRVELPPNGITDASSPIGGRIVEVLVEPGQRVKKGQRLFSVFNLELIDWQRDHQQHTADLNFLSKEVARLKSLMDENLAPENEYDKVLSQYEVKALELRAIARKLEAMGIKMESTNQQLQDHFFVVASQAGRVEHVNINGGAYVEPSASLVEIINDEHLHLHLQAYGRQSELLQEDQTLQFNVISRPGDIREARIKWINNVVEEENNSYDIHAEIIGNDRGLIAGEFVEARILSTSDSLLSLPAKAVTFDRGLQYVFVVDGADSQGTHFRKVQIQSGIEDLGYVEILAVDPLSLNDQVVVDGAFFLMAENKKQEMGEIGHSHGH